MSQRMTPNPNPFFAQYKIAWESGRHDYRTGRLPGHSPYSRDEEPVTHAAWLAGYWSAHEIAAGG